MESDTPLLYLIKDFVDQKIVFYWSDPDDNTVSPLFVSLKQAEEWWLRYDFALYKGVERRASIYDRRRLHAQRTKEDKSHHIPSQNPNGRRHTDIEIRVDKDFSRVKMLQFYARNPHLLESGDD